MSLPVLTLDEEAFAANRDLMLRYAAEQGAAIAPHAKTPMAPELAASLVEAGAWGTTVADIRQAAVMLRAGLNRLILANQVGGAGGAAGWPGCTRPIPGPRSTPSSIRSRPRRRWTPPGASARWRRCRCWSRSATGRAGARDLAVAERVIADAIQASEGRLRLAGIGAYEGAAATADAERTETAHRRPRCVGGPGFPRCGRRSGRSAPLILTAGGSVFFDMIVAASRPVAAADGKARLVLRSGAIFFHDHGIYERALGGARRPQGFRLGGAALRRVRRVPPGAAALGRGAVAPGAGPRHLRHGHARRVVRPGPANAAAPTAPASRCRSGRAEISAERPACLPVVRRATTSPSATSSSSASRTPAPASTAIA